MTAGSPPHARGRPGRRDGCGGRLGITPACAGKTRAAVSSRRLARDHPRMRGEDPQPQSTDQDDPGSPPHARGRPTGMSFTASVERITPACAGKTSSVAVTRTSVGDHPRMRGEDSPRNIFTTVRAGSPPHARGRREAELVVALAQRITPACAGKTCLARLGRVRAGDHPRMRGEDSLYSALDIHGAGSPPHARGRHAH